MKAVVIEAFGQHPIVKELPVPIPISGQVLIKVDSAPINPSDLAFLLGQYQSDKGYPCVPGFEGAGTVVQNGGGIIGWKVTGKRVAFYTGSNFGSYGEYCIADAKACLVLDDDMKLPESSCAFVNPLTAMAMLEVAKANNVNAIVHSVAASSLGRMMIRLFQQNGVRIINIVRREAQIELLKKEGAEIILNSNDEGFTDKLRELTHQLRATIFFDALGGEITGQVLEAMPNDSTAYVYGGLSRQPVSNVSIGDLIFKGKKVEGFWLTKHIGQKNIISQVLFLNNMKSMLRTTLKTHIAKEFSIEQFKDAVDYYVKNMSEGKVLIRGGITNVQESTIQQAEPEQPKQDS